MSEPIAQLGPTTIGIIHVGVVESYHAKAEPVTHIFKVSKEVSPVTLSEQGDNDDTRYRIKLFQQAGQAGFTVCEDLGAGEGITVSEALAEAEGRINDHFPDSEITNISTVNRIEPERNE